MASVRVRNENSSPKTRNNSNPHEPKMQMMSNFQSEVSNRLAVLERRENFQQTVLTGVENPQSFGESYGSGQGGSFNRSESPIRERHSNRDEVDVLSKSEKWLPNPPTPDTS